MKKHQIILNITLVIILVLIVVFLFDIFWLKTAHPYVSGYVCNFITECIGIVITVYFIQSIFDKYSEEEKMIDERNKIIRQNKFITEIIKQYILFFNCVVQPIETRKAEYTFQEQFELKDLCDLHKITLLIVAPCMQSSIEVFYRYEKQLRQLFIKMLETIDFNFYPELEKIIMKFITESTKSDVSDTIINNQKLTLSDGKKYTDMIHDMLCGDDIEHMYSDYKQDKLNANGIMPYFMLYDLLKEERSLIMQYQKEISKISE